MDLLSRIASWLGENEATISAVVGITVLAGVIFAGLRSLVRRQHVPAQEKASSAATEPASAAEASPPDLDPLTVPGFEGRPAIAVLPFDNLSGDPEQEYFADGIAEDLITLLSLWREFPVIARNSSFTYKGTAVDVKRVSRELGVRYVVEGSVRKKRDQVRITAQLIDATTGGHVWAERYDRELEDIFAVQDEIATGIATAMGAQLVQAEEERAAKQSPQNLTAYDLFMRGRHCYGKGWLEGNIQEAQAEARSFFEQAIEVDPNFAAAFAWLAISYSAAWFSLSDASAQTQDKLERAAQRSVLLDSELPVAHLAVFIAHQLRGEREEALAAAHRAIELNPSFARAYRYLGGYLAETGEPEEAILVLGTGMRLSPRNPWLCEFLRHTGRAHFAAGRYEDAVECLKQSIATGRSLAGAPWSDLAASHAHLGQLEAAQAAFQKAEARFGFRQTEDDLRQIFAYIDRTDFFERWIDGLRKAGLPEGTEE
jgi:adenylate cyclase